MSYRHLAEELELAVALQCGKGSALGDIVAGLDCYIRYVACDGRFEQHFAAVEILFQVFVNGLCLKVVGLCGLEIAERNHFALYKLGLALILGLGVVVTAFGLGIFDGCIAVGDVAGFKGKERFAGLHVAAYSHAVAIEYLTVCCGYKGCYIFGGV